MARASAANRNCEKDMCDWTVLRGMFKLKAEIVQIMWMCMVLCSREFECAMWIVQQALQTVQDVCNQVNRAVCKRLQFHANADYCRPTFSYPRTFRLLLNFLHCLSFSTFLDTFQHFLILNIFVLTQIFILQSNFMKTLWDVQPFVIV